MLYKYFSIYFIYFSFVIVSSAINLFTIPINIANILIISSIPVVNDSTVNLTWTPPTSPNGYISGYNIAVHNKRNQSNSTTFVPSTPDTHVYTNLITQLGKLLKT